MSHLLTVEGLNKTFESRGGALAGFGIGPKLHVNAIADASFALRRREVLALVGESGSGKTTLARCLLRLIEPDCGQATFDGQEVFSASAKDLRDIRRRMQLIYQDPYSSLNPLMTIADAIGEPARVHGLVRGRSEEQALVSELLTSVGLGDDLANRRPRALSGGQRQRVAIARALAASPDVLIADEAVSALDVSVQAQILNLFEELTRKRALAMLFITHQLAVVAQIAHRVAVMYLGRIIETGPVADVFRRPRHPYTALLLDAHPGLDGVRRKLVATNGEAPSAVQLPQGCRFASRCRLVRPKCTKEDPMIRDIAPGHSTACHFPDEVVLQRHATPELTTPTLYVGPNHPIHLE